MAAEQPYNQFIERELLRRIAEGDEAAFAQLFRQWRHVVTGYVLRITESKELSEEILQDVFMKIWKVRETMPEIVNFKNFILVVARNQSYNVLKTQLTERKRKRAWEAGNDAPIYSVQNNEDLNHEAATIVEEAINALHERRKEVYLLSRHERLSYQEIADKLGISINSVKTHLRLATESITSFIKSHLSSLIGLAMMLFRKL